MANSERCACLLTNHSLQASSHFGSFCDRANGSKRKYGQQKMGMLDREFDVVVLGATGYTGNRVLEYLLSIEDASGLKIGAAGRSRVKLENSLRVLDAARVQVLGTDTSSSADLRLLAAKARVILNCVGPYRYTGEAVACACAEVGTDLLDISGEPEFMELVDFRFGESARASGCFIASGCGFDSVVADLGTIYVQRKFSATGLPSSVEAFLSLHTTTSFRLNYATWESAVHGFASADSLRKLRKQVRASGKDYPPPRLVGPKLMAPAGASYDPRIEAYVVPFPGSDASVVRRTQRALSSLGQAPVQFAASFCVSSRWGLLLLAVFGLIFRTLSGLAIGRFLLLTCPELFSYGVFSKRGPTQKQLETTSFSMLFIGRGYFSADSASSSMPPDREVRVKVVGPEVGYVATPILFVQAALTLLQERDNITKQLGPGGVFTPGTLLSGTRYIERLKGAGISFQDVSDRKI